MKRRPRFSRAQFIVLFTLALPVLVGVIGLGADFAIVYFNWANLQKAADSAALAGAEYLITNPAPPTPPPTASSCPAFVGGNSTIDPKSVACTYAVLNTAKRSEFTANVPAPNPPATLPPGVSTIQVILDRPQIPTYFLRLVGVSSLGAKAAATAVGPTVPNCSSLFPIALQCNAPCDMTSLDPGQTTTFGSKFVDGLADGNWQWTNVGQGTGVGSGDGSGLAGAIKNGLSGTYCLGESISTSPGNKGASGNVKNGLDARLASCAQVTASTDPCQNNGSIAGIPSNDPCLITVPAVDFSGCTGDCTMPIEGFAEIYMEQTSTTAKIQGCFVKAVNSDSYVSGGTTGPNLGVLTPPYLVQ